MFVGHYGPAFIAKRADRTIPLWVLFIAVQFLDVLWAPFVLLGIEKVRIVPGFTKASALDLYYMPYTHGLLTAIGWSIVFGGAYQLIARPSTTRASIIVGLAVFSHWVLDLLVHLHDLPLYDNSAKVGFGLWNVPAVELPLEALILLGGIWLCFHKNPSRAKGTFIFGAVLVVVQIYSFLAPPPASDTAIAVTAILSYIVFALVIWWLQDRKRSAATM